MRRVRQLLGGSLIVMLVVSLVFDHLAGAPFTIGQLANIAVTMTLIAGLLGWIPLGTVSVPVPPELRLGVLRTAKEAGGPLLTLSMSGVNRGEDAWWIERVAVLSPEDLVIARAEGAYRLAGDAATDLEISLVGAHLNSTTLKADGRTTVYETLPVSSDDLMYGSRRLTLQLVHRSGQVYTLIARTYVADPDISMRLVAAYQRGRGVVDFNPTTVVLVKEKAPWNAPRVEPSSVVEIGDRSPAEVVSAWRKVNTTGHQVVPA